MDGDASLRRFARAIAVTAPQKTAALRTGAAIARKLHSVYYPRERYRIRWTPIGAYAKGTATQPPRDIDMAFVLPYELFLRYNRAGSGGQARLLDDVRARLIQRYPSTKIRRDRVVVALDFGTGTHRAEVVPGFQLSHGVLRIPNSSGHGRWDEVQHIAEIKRVANSERYTGGKTRDLIRLLKVWQAQVPDKGGRRIASLTLELEAVSFLRAWPEATDRTASYEHMVRDFLAHLLAHAGRTRPIPGTRDLKEHGHGWVADAESAHAQAVLACEHSSRKEHDDARHTWGSVFGRRFAP